MPEFTGSKLLLDEIAQVFELDGQINIVDHHFFRDVQDTRREIRNHLAELLDIITKTPSAELSKVGEVLAELSGFHPRGLRQSVTGHRADAIFFQSMQAIAPGLSVFDCRWRVQSHLMFGGCA